MSPNDYVRVKLTEAGKRALVANDDLINGDMRERGLIHRFHTKWDADGWIREQYWGIMAKLNWDWRVGGEMPFTEMEIEK